MEKFTFKKGRHRPKPFRIAALNPIFRFNKEYFKKTFSKQFMFHPDCRYDIGIDQSDWNKLYGVFLGVFGIHKHSFRFVWRYCQEYDKIEIGAYYYFNTEKWRVEHLCYVDFNTIIQCSLSLKSAEGRVVATFSTSEPYNNKRSHHSMSGILNSSPLFGFGCGLYFGGNRTAPHSMIILASKLDEKS